MQVTIITGSIPPRLAYVCRVIFNQLLQVGFQIEKAENPKKWNVINYSEKTVDGAVNIFPSGLLSEKGTVQREIQSGQYENLITLFHHDKGDIPFDIFSAIFYMLTRYEEYLPFEPDKHGRFPATESIAFKNGFHQLPIVEIWAKMLAEKLGISFPLNKKNPLITIDVDYTWKFKNKGFYKTLGGTAKSLLKGNVKEAIQRMKVVLGAEKDPFSTYEYLKEFAKTSGGDLTYFVLVGNKGAHDTAFPLTNPNQQTHVVALSINTNIGIHPSYTSNSNFEILEEELKTLKEAIGSEITRSRQHYLILKFPETYKNLLQNGILNDYSMGWHDMPGFRAGISRPYPFYSLETGTTTPLVVHPFVAMDRTLKDYMGLNSEDALMEIEKLKQAVKDVNGQFMMIWHNDSVSDTGEWKGWRTVFEKSV